MHFIGPAKFTKYWDLGWVRYLYNELGDKNSKDNKVDHLWTSIFMREFPATEEYLLFIRDRLNEQTKESPDIMVKQLQNGNPFTLIIMENKRASSVGQDAVWAAAVEELTQYLDSEMECAKPKPKFQVGLVAIGRHVRFYQRVEHGSVQDYPGTGGKAYQIRDDKVEVQDILVKIKAQTKQK